MKDIEIFIKYQETFFEQENKGHKSKEYIRGYVRALKDIKNLIEYNTSKSDLHPNARK